MTRPPRLPGAEAQVRAARAKLFGTLGEVQRRLSPSNVVQDAMQTAAEGATAAARKGAEMVRKRPWAVGAVAGAIGLVMARGWIFDMVRGRKGKHATRARTAGLDSKQTKAARRAKKG